MRWLGKIQARDFFPGERYSEAGEMVERCRRTLRGFAQRVYEAEDAGVPPAALPAAPPADGR